MTSARGVIERSGLDIDATEFEAVEFRPMPVIMGRILNRRVEAMTLGSCVFVVPGSFDDVVAGHRPGLVAHELLHTVQWKTDGPTFLPRYLAEYIRFRMYGASHDAAYRSISYEVAAYRAGLNNRRDAL